MCCFLEGVVIEFRRKKYNPRGDRQRKIKKEKEIGNRKECSHIHTYTQEKRQHRKKAPNGFLEACVLPAFVRKMYCRAGKRLSSNSNARRTFFSFVCSSRLNRACDKSSRISRGFAALRVCLSIKIYMRIVTFRLVYGRRNIVYYGHSF